MSGKTVAAFLAGALAASTGSAVAFTNGHLFRLQGGDHARYGPIVCNARHVAQYSTFECVGVRRYRIIYGLSELRVLRSNDKGVFQQVFAADPSGR